MSSEWLYDGYNAIESMNIDFEKLQKEIYDLQQEKTIIEEKLAACIRQATLIQERTSELRRIQHAQVDYF